MDWAGLYRIAVSELAVLFIGLLAGIAIAGFVFSRKR